MGKISDIWVRLGLKKDGYDKGMNDAGKKAEGFGNTLSKVKAGALAVWAAIGASVVAFGKKMIETTNSVGDAWARFTAQARAGWDTFVQSLSAMNWTDFIGRFREATQAAKELQNALDAEYEISNSIKLQKAAMAEELNALEILARNSSKPYEVRAKAAQDYLDKVRPLYEQEKDLANKLLDAQQGKWLAGSGLTDSQQTRDDLTKFLVDYGKTNNGVANAIGRMLELQEQYDGLLSVRLRTGDFSIGKQTVDEYRALRDYVQNFASQNGYQTDIYKLAQVYETLRGDKDTQPLIDALIRAGEAAGAFDRETKRMQMALNTATSALEEAADSLEETATKAERQDLSLPAMSAVKGLAEIEMPDLFSKDWLARQSEMGLEAVEKQAEWLGIMEQAAVGMRDTLISAMGNGLQAITDMMMGLGSADSKSMFAAFLAPFGNFAKQMGAMIMSYGLSMDAFKNAFAVPGVAIAAGAGLMAIGAAISSGAQKLSQGSLSGGASTAYTGGSPSGADVASYESTLTVEVVGRLNGSDILLAGQKTQNKWNR
jgi:uncharacterized protein YukE